MFFAVILRASSFLGSTSLDGQALQVVFQSPGIWRRPCLWAFLFGQNNCGSIA